MQTPLFSPVAVNSDHGEVDTWSGFLQSPIGEVFDAPGKVPLFAIVEVDAESHWVSNRKVLPRLRVSICAFESSWTPRPASG